MNKMEKYKLKLQGATCPSCIYAIEKTGSKMDHVQKIFVNAADSSLNLETDDADETLGKVRDMIRKIGYDVDIENPIDVHS